MYGNFAKFYILGQFALIGSANLTDAGMKSNRELSIAIGSEDEVFDEVPAFFDELWNSASVLTTDALDRFRSWRRQNSVQYPTSIDGIEPSSPVTVAVKTQAESRTRTYLESFRALYVEKLIPAHEIVEKIYAEQGRRHPAFVNYSHDYEIDRFLFWVRSFTSDEELDQHPIRSGDDLRENIRKYVSEWFQIAPSDLNIDQERLRRISGLRTLLSDEAALERVEMDEIVDLLQGCAAFVELQRFAKGGLATHIEAFKKDNEIAKVRRSFHHLAFGSGEYVQRVYDCIYLPEYKLAHWGRNCNLELFGWTNREGVPPFNGRIMKALRFLGFDVPT
jgi:PLD-like domain